jgi:hypothetical protein
MTIKKQEFYEGAAIHKLARSGAITNIRYEPPFFIVNNRLVVLLKYSTRGRSPWGFTFVAEEQALLEARAAQFETVIGLICGADGVAAFTYDAYREIAAPRASSVHIACYRQHRQRYEVNGPDGALTWKVAPSDWERILEERGADEAS